MVKGHVPTAATRAKISAALKGRHHTYRGPAHRPYRARGPMSAATRAKISAALRGRTHPHKGHPMSAESRAKLSASLKAYYASHPGAASARARKGWITRKSRGISGYKY